MTPNVIKPIEAPGAAGIRSIRWIAISILSALIGVAGAEPLVIYDSGNTRPITDYRPDPNSLEYESQARQQSVHPAPKPESLWSRVFPIHTPELTPGYVAPRKADFPQLTRPIFLIGTDDRSRNWLLQYREKLREVGAAGMVVEAETDTDYLAIEAIAEGLQLVPAAASQFAKQLDLRHYPVLITRELIEQ